MNITTGISTLSELITQQISNNFLITSQEKEDLARCLDPSLVRLTSCFREISNKYYSNDHNATIFNPYHSGQHTTFLYFLSCEAAALGKTTLADKIYYLNRMMNGLDLFYHTKLSEVFFMDHPLGSILGRATYGNHFVFNQQCTVGGNHDVYPILGNYVTLFAGASVIGRCQVGNNVFVSAGAYIKDENIPDNSIVFGRSPRLVIKQKPLAYFYEPSPFKCHHE